MSILKTNARAEFKPRVDLEKVTAGISADDEALNTPVEFYNHGVAVYDIASPYGAPQEVIDENAARAKKRYPLIMKKLGVGHFRVYGLYTTKVETVLLDKAIGAAARENELAAFQQSFDIRYADGLRLAANIASSSFYSGQFSFGAGWKSQFDISVGASPASVFYPYAIYDELSKVAYEPSIEFVSETAEQITETLLFSNVAVQSTSKLHTGSIITLYASRFVNAAGDEILPPLIDQVTGELKATETCYGAMVVKYAAPYRLYRVTYSLPTDSALTAKIHHGMLYGVPGISMNPGQEAQDAIGQLPGVQVLVLAKDAAVVVEVPRHVWPATFWTTLWNSTFVAEDNGAASDYGFQKNSEDFLQLDTTVRAQNDAAPKLNEQSRVVDTVRVENPLDVDQFVDVERVREMVMKDENGRSWTLKMLP